MKVGKWFGKREAPVIYEDDILVSDEWYQYYRKCTKNIRKITSILENFTNQPQGYSKTDKFWEDIVEIGFLADIKDPEEMKEWLLHCKTMDNAPKKEQNGFWIKPQKKQVTKERRKDLHEWKKRAKSVNIDLMPSNRPFRGQRKEWEESVIRAERSSKTKNGKYTPGDGAYKWECIDKLKSLRKNDSFRVEGRVYQTVAEWLGFVHHRMKEFSDKQFALKEIDHNTQIIWRVK